MCRAVRLATMGSDAVDEIPIGVPSAPTAPAVTMPRINSRKATVERGTGIEPATNSVEGCDSTVELPPLELEQLYSTSNSRIERRPEASKLGLWSNMVFNR